MGPLSRYSIGEYAITCNLNRFQTNSVNASGSSKLVFDKPIQPNQFKNGFSVNTLYESAVHNGLIFIVCTIKVKIHVMHGFAVEESI